MRTVLLNATAIGPRPDGISTYALQLLRGLAALDTTVPFRVLLNEAARERLREVPPGGRAGGGQRGRLAAPRERRQPAAARARGMGGWRTRPGGALSPLEAPLLGPPSVVTVHDLTPLHFPDDHPRQRHFYRRLLPPALRRAARLVVPSASTREALLARYGLAGERIRVILHGPPVPLRTAPPPQGRTGGRLHRAARRGEEPGDAAARVPARTSACPAGWCWPGWA
jgi:glycosyltransferase involved in cell wall biosynthesis